jgi:hypothetical protein
MLKNLKKGFLPFLIGFSALSVSASAAFYSVFGLSKLFAGASTEVIIMAGSLEIAKLVTASLLYQYWDSINKILRAYLATATVILVLITSMGIYGFLSAAYQETFNQLTIVENEKKFIQQKVDFYQQDVTRYEKELQQILDNITSLSEARSVSIQVKDTSVVGGVRNTISTVDLRASQARLTVEENKRKDVNLKRDIAVDSLRTYQRQILELDNNVEVAGELGPLKYLSGLTGYPMDKIINLLLLVIIFVFDPLAVSLVIAANFAYNKARPKKNLYGETVQEENIPSVWDTTIQDGLEDEPEWEFTTYPDPRDIEVKEKLTPFPEDYNEEDERRMNIIGQNGNDGEHYDNKEDFNELDLNKDGKIDKSELQAAKDRIEFLQNSIKGVTKSSNRVDKSLKEIKKLKALISSLDDDLTITY